MATKADPVVASQPDKKVAMAERSEAAKESAKAEADRRKQDMIDPKNWPPVNPGDESLEDMAARGVKIEDGRVMPDDPPEEVELPRDDSHMKPDVLNESLMDKVTREGGMPTFTKIQDLAKKLNEGLVSSVFGMGKDYHYALNVLNYATRTLGTQWIRETEKPKLERRKAEAKKDE